VYYTCFWLCLSDQREREIWQKRTCPLSSSPKGKGPSFLSGNWWTNWRLKRRTINEISQKAEIRKLLKKSNTCHVLQLNGHWKSQSKKVDWCVVELVYYWSLTLASCHIVYYILYLLSFLLIHYILTCFLRKLCCEIKKSEENKWRDGD